MDHACRSAGRRHHERGIRRWSSRTAERLGSHPMQRVQLLALAIGAGLMAVLLRIAMGRLPRWLRFALVAGLVLIGFGGGLFAYRYVTRPTTLTVAAGSLGGDAPRYISAIAARLASSGAPVRLKVLPRPRRWTPLTRFPPDRRIWQSHARISAIYPPQRPCLSSRMWSS